VLIDSLTKGLIMDNNTKQKLIVIAAVLAAALTFYFIASPYQHCIRSGFYDNWCTANSSW
jgi:hypothetical protein